MEYEEEVKKSFLGKLSQQEINKLDEIHILSEFIEQVLQEENLSILKWEKLEEAGASKPDFRCIIGGGEVVFIEVTKVLSADGYTSAKNRFYEKLENKLETAIKGAGFNNVHILIIVDYNANLKRGEKKIIENFVKLLKLRLNDDGPKRKILVKQEEIGHLSQKLSSIKQVILFKSNYLKVEINKWISNPKDLPERIKDTIEKKEGKDYKEGPLWLLIYVDDDVTNVEHVRSFLLKNTFRFKSSKFSRIYILLSYCPRTKKYPLFRLR